MTLKFLLPLLLLAPGCYPPIATTRPAIVHINIAGKGAPPSRLDIPGYRWTPYRDGTVRYYPEWDEHQPNQACSDGWGMNTIFSCDQRLRRVI